MGDSTDSAGHKQVQANDRPNIWQVYSRRGKEGVAQRKMSEGENAMDLSHPINNRILGSLPYFKFSVSDRHQSFKGEERQDH